MNIIKKFFHKGFDEMIDHCGGCYWRSIGRHQKCSCCRRNQSMKDNYKSITEALLEAQEGE